MLANQSGTWPGPCRYPLASSSGLQASPPFRSGGRGTVAHSRPPVFPFEAPLSKAVRAWSESTPSVLSSLGKPREAGRSPFAIFPCCLTIALQSFGCIRWDLPGRWRASWGLGGSCRRHRRVYGGRLALCRSSGGRPGSGPHNRRGDGPAGWRMGERGRPSSRNPDWRQESAGRAATCDCCSHRGSGGRCGGTGGHFGYPRFPSGSWANRQLGKEFFR